MADVSGVGGSNLQFLIQQAEQGLQKSVGGKGPVDQKGLLGGHGSNQVPPSMKFAQAGGGGGDMTPDGPDAAMAVTLAEIRSVSGKASELLNKVLVTQLQQQSNELLQQQLAARQAAKASLLGAADDLRNQGADLLKGAVASFAISVSVSAVSMGLSVAGGLSSLKGLGQEGKETEETVNSVKAIEKDVGEIKKSFKEIESESSKIVIGAHRGMSDEQKLENTTTRLNDSMKDALNAVRNTKNKYSELGSLMTGMSSNLTKLGESASNFASSMGQYDQKLDEAQQKTDEANAQQADALVDAAKDARQKLGDMVDKVIEFIKDIRDAKADMMASVVHKGA